MRREDYVVNHRLTVLPLSSLDINRAFEDAYVLMSDPSAIPQVSAQISALDAGLFKNLVVSIMQLISLIRALEVVVVRTFNSIRRARVTLSRLSLSGLPGHPRSYQDVELYVQGQSGR